MFEMSYSLVDVMFQYYVVLVGGCWWMLCFNTMSYTLVDVLIINALCLNACVCGCCISTCVCNVAVICDYV